MFLDGVGVGEDDPGVNPLAAAELPTFRRLVGGRPTAALLGDGAARSAPGRLVPLDATLGLPGLPQSGTGHTALLTGENAAAAFGRHFGPWVPTALRPMLRERSLLARAVAAGRRVAFANAYPEELLRGGQPKGPLLRAGPPIAALGAGVLTRHTDALRAGEAVSSEITNDGWRDRLGRADLPDPTPAQAGANLARIAAAHDLTLFAHYTTDYVGHRGGMQEAVAAIERVDAFLGGTLAGLPPALTLLVVSDHGNLEDARAGHTLNPALGVIHGPGAPALAPRLGALTDVAPAVLDWLGAAPTGMDDGERAWSLDRGRRGG